MPRKLILTFMAIALLVAVGCDSGPKLYPVRGVVRFTDGKLLRQGSIEFEYMDSQDRHLARAEIQPDGSYVLGTDDLDDGAVPGKYRAVVISSHMIGSGPERPGLIPKERVHRKHAKFSTSGLEYVVEPKNNNILIEVEYAPDSNSKEGAGNKSNKT